MHLYICVFLIYPTFVGSECNKVIVIVVNEWDSENDSYPYHRTADARVCREVAFRCARDPTMTFTLRSNIIYFLPNFSHAMFFYSVNTSYKTFIVNYEKKSLSTSQSNAQRVLFAQLIVQSLTGSYFPVDSAKPVHFAMVSLHGR